jgi:hypothetical protein
LERRIRRKTLWRNLLILILCVGTAGAEQDAGSIRSQQEPSPSSIQPPAPQSTLELPTGPSNPVLEIPGKPPDPALSVVLPSQFVGCWEGTIEGFDSLTPIAFLSSTIRGTHVTYRFCYLPNSNGATYRLELRKLVIAEKELTPTSFENQVVWRDEHRGTGYLRNHLFVTQRSWFLFIPISVDTEYYAEEIVTLDNDPNLLKMRGAELMKLSGSDYARIGFHADFHRVADQHE